MYTSALVHGAFGGRAPPSGQLIAPIFGEKACGVSRRPMTMTRLAVHIRIPISVRIPIKLTWWN
ncbi:MAG: hypothetical protein ACJAYU_005162 [Bradymonadia bacterium]|jgi:hypothetical protein